MPQQGNQTFGILCVNGPPNDTGYLVLSRGKMAPPLRLLGCDIWGNPLPGSLFPLLPVKSDSSGDCEVGLPLPAGTVGISFCAQFVWLPAGCGAQPHSASNAVQVTIQP